MKKLLVANTASGARRISQVFSDFCEVAAIAIRNSVERDGFRKREDRYLEVTTAYQREELDRFAEVLALLGLELERNPSDVLGSLYMSLDLGNAGTGQFFTPYEVSRIMAAMTIGDVSGRLTEESSFITLAEPTCGAGGMIIAASDVIRSQGFDPTERMHVTAQDVDIIAVHMTYLQISLLGLPGVVHHGDTLKAEIWDSWPTPAHVVGRWPHRLAQRE